MSLVPERRRVMAGVRAVCPKCGGHDVDEWADEVDIGVGVQRHVRGIECATCGQIALLDCCRAWDFQPHTEFCEGDSR